MSIRLGAQYGVMGCPMCRKELTQQDWDCFPWKGLHSRLALCRHLGTWEAKPSLHGFKTCPQSWGWFTMPRLLVQRTWLMLNTCFSFKSLEFWHMLGRGCLCDQLLIKTMATEFLMSFSGRQKHVFTFHHWKNEACPVWLLWEKTLAPGFPKTSPHMPFPFADVALYPLTAITLICWICEY